MYNNTSIVVETFGIDTVKQAQKNLDTKGFDGQPKGRKKTNTGRLKNSLVYEIKRTSYGYLIEFVSSENYAAIVEEGRNKGAKMPPSAPLDRWAIQRNIRGTRDNKGRFTPRKSIVFAIRRSIAINGIKPVRYFSLAMNKVFEGLPDKLQTALVQDLEDIMYDDFTKMGFKVTKNGSIN